VAGERWPKLRGNFGFPAAGSSPFGVLQLHVARYERRFDKYYNFVVRARITYQRFQQNNIMATKSKSTKSPANAAPSDSVTSRSLNGLRLRRPSSHGAYGWVRDLPDTRDFLYAAPLGRFPQGLPTAVDLRPECPPVFDQGQLGSCTANGIGGAIQFDQLKQKSKAFVPSRLFIYYNERVIEGTVSQDSGAQVRDGMKVVSTLGAPPETEWPYDIKLFSQKPPASAYTDAKQDLVSMYSRVLQNLPQMQGCLADGFPFVFGFTAYDSFETPAVASSGVLPMPAPNESVVGGHCVLAVGYDNSKRVFIIRNSWGSTWGMSGYFTMPYEYLLNPHLANDFWTVRSVTG
jgi:C1A family cysteine protease